MIIRKGDQGDRVRAVQRALIAHGLTLTDGADGIFGGGTESVVKAFQRQKGLSDDGVVGDKTLAALGLDPDTLKPVSGTKDAVGDAPKVAPPPPPPPQDPVWSTDPLPASAAGRFSTALSKLQALVDAADDDREWRYECWFKKLNSAGVDDRVIQWGRICPRTSGAIGAAFVVGPCDMSIGMRPSQEDIESAIKSIDDVEAAGQSLGIFTHLKADIVVSAEMTEFPLENLRTLHDDVQLAIEKLDQWANSDTGGSSAMPPAYVSIKDWIGRRQSDPNSLYSCM